jgi:anaerobic selenocysteine-containing dehydrogenase
MRDGLRSVQFVDLLPTRAGGRACLTDPSSQLPVPRYTPEPNRRLTMLTPATSRTINSMFADTAPPRVVVSLHADDAAARGIADGASVRVFNELAEITLTAAVDGSVRPGVISIPKGLWRRHFDGGLTANALIAYGEADLGRNACFNDAQVEVVAV